MEEEGQAYWVRHVIVPGYTDIEEDLHGLAHFLQDKRYLERLELLPYHNLGEYKWQELGLKYELTGVKAPARERMKEIEGLFRDYGITI